MLIHKATMGVLEYIWTGEYRKDPGCRFQIPRYRAVTLSEMEHSDDWWVIESTGTLAKKIRAHYPWITPVVDSDGELIDVLLQSTAAKTADDREFLREDAARRGYKKRLRLRPRGIMPFLVGDEPYDGQESRY